MTPTRKTEINGQKIAEYYWAGDYVCYVNNRAAAVGYDQAVEVTRQGASVRLLSSLGSE